MSVDVLAERLLRFGRACRANPRVRGGVALAASMGLPLHLVGGSVRDVLLGLIEPSDLDYAVGGDALALSRAVADGLGGTWVPLDVGRRMARVVFRLADGGLEVHDFAAWQAGTLEDDLLKRDLAINAMALDPRPWMERPEAPGTGPTSGVAVDLEGLVDPAGGRHDLARGVVRAISAATLEDDPLRLLRVVRFSATLGFDIDPETLAMLAPRAPLLARVADERMRDELFKILGAPGCLGPVEVLWRTGLLSVVLPETAPVEPALPVAVPRGSGSGAEARPAALEALRCVEEGLGRGVDPGMRLGETLQRRISSGHPATSLLRLGALLLRGCDARAMEAVGVRLRLSRAERSLLAGFARGWLRVREEAREPGPLPPHRRRRFFAALDEAAPGAALLARLVGGEGEEPSEARARKAHARALLEWFEVAGPEASQPMLDGRAVKTITGIRPGPRLGRMLDALLDAQVDGRVRTREEAVAFMLELAHEAPGP